MCSLDVGRERPLWELEAAPLNRTTNGDDDIEYAKVVECDLQVEDRNDPPNSSQINIVETRGRTAHRTTNGDDNIVYAEVVKSDSRVCGASMES